MLQPRKSIELIEEVISSEAMGTRQCRRLLCAAAKSIAEHEVANQYDANGPMEHVKEGLRDFWGKVSPPDPSNAEVEHVAESLVCLAFSIF